MSVTRDRYGTPLVPRDRDNMLTMYAISRQAWFHVISVVAAGLYQGGVFHRRVPFA